MLSVYVNKVYGRFKSNFYRPVTRTPTFRDVQIQLQIFFSKKDFCTENWYKIQTTYIIKFWTPSM
jgi:hypothetical protein